MIGVDVFSLCIWCGIIDKTHIHYLYHKQTAQSFQKMYEGQSPTNKATVERSGRNKRIRVSFIVLSLSDDTDINIGLTH